MDILGGLLIKSVHPLKKTSTRVKVLNIDVKTRVTNTGQKISTKLQIKDKTKDQHKHDLIYYSKIPEPTCNEDYLGETGRIITERSSDHCGEDKQSHLFRHALNNNQRTVDLKDFKIIDFVTITIGSKEKSQKPYISNNTNHL